MRSDPAGPEPIGIWLTRGTAREVDAWAARGVVPVAVARLGLHTALVPRGHCQVGAPYEDAATMCAARAAPTRLAPAVGFWVIDGRAVLTVQSTCWRRRIRWVIWDPEVGLMCPPGVDIATPQQVLTAAGGGTRAELVDMFAERHHRPQRLLAGLMGLLGLPGGDVLLEPSIVDRWERAQVHEPDRRQVHYFHDAVKDGLALRRELGTGV